MSFTAIPATAAAQTPARFVMVISDPAASANGAPTSALNCFTMERNWANPRRIPDVFNCVDPRNVAVAILFS